MFRGFSKIFAFTFTQHVKSKGYKALTVVLAVLCLVLPIIIMGVTAYLNTANETLKNRESEENINLSEDEVEDMTINIVETVFVVDMTEGIQADFSILNTIGEERFTDIEYTICTDVDTALEQAEQRDYSLVAVVEYTDDLYDVKLLLPETTSLTWEDAYSYDSFLYSYFKIILVQKSGLDYTQLVELLKPVESNLEIDDTTSGNDIADDEKTENEETYEMIREIFSMILPYVTIMVLYFMILFYGQGVANSVIMEKTSKLMDVFLVTVKPPSMIMGKILGTALSGIMQLSIWIISIVVGFVGGTSLAKFIDPDTSMAIIQLFDSFGELSGMFSIVNVALCILVIIAGFLMYCALSAVGGAMASKPEDLGTTNGLFTMALVFSFLLTLNSGVMSQVNETATSFAWQYYVPFTAIFIVPSETLLGNMSAFQIILSLGCMLITTLLIIILAGKIYSMMVLYKGNPPTLKKMVKMLRKKV